MTDERMLDIRTVERHIRRGKLDRTTYDKHVESLPDLAEQSEAIDYATQFKEEAQAEAAEAAAAAEREDESEPAGEGAPTTF